MHSLLHIHHANAVEQQRSAVRRPLVRSFATSRSDTRSARRHTPKAHSGSGRSHRIAISVSSAPVPPLPPGRDGGRRS